MVTIEGLNEADEIAMYATRRYISACQAYWRIAEFEIVKMIPSVVQLALHLPGQQPVRYEPTRQGARDALANNKVTPLMGYFLANQNPFHGKLARQTKYEDFPSKFVWKDDTKVWQPRQWGYTIGRMVSIHPNCNETFYLRMLLKHVAGATSFNHLKTVEGVSYHTFREACIALNLCQDDSHWIDCLTEATAITVPRGLRTLFCNILVNCDPTSPNVIFDRFENAMSEDFKHNRRFDMLSTEDQLVELIRNDLLQDINNFLQQYGKLNSDYFIDMPDNTLQTSAINNEGEIDMNAEQFFNNNHSLLNDEQLEIFNIIRQHVDNEEGGMYTFDAPGGSGKTFLANIILAYVRMNRKIAVATALSGIAATLLTLGTTFHRRFGVPIPCTSTSSSKLRLNSNEARILKESALIMVDEVSMMDFKLLDLLDRFLRVLMQQDMWMGGKLVILMHDFRQILPVVPGGNRASIVSTSVLSSDAWPHFKSLHLTQNMRVERLLQSNTCHERAEHLRQYGDWLLRVGNGTQETVLPNSLIIEIPRQMVCESKCDLESKVYNDFLQNCNNEQYLFDRAIMSSTNDTIQQCNYDMITTLPGEMLISESIDSCIEDNDIAQYDSDFLNKINASGIPPHRLALKVGACIILIRNLSIKDGHCNGTRCILLHLLKQLIKANHLSGGPNAEILIPRIPMISKDTDFPVQFKRLQFPVLGAYYLTLNRAQGQTLKRAGLYLPRSVFSHGHVYVGFSRCGDPDNIFVFENQDEFDNIRQLLPRHKVFTRNVVFREIFQRQSHYE